MFTLKISKDGEDALQAEAKDLLFYAEHSVFKIAASSSDSVSAGGTKSLAHGFSYLPTYMAFSNDGSGNWYPVLSEANPAGVSSTVDSTNVVLYNGAGGARTVRTFIFVDPAA